MAALTAHPYELLVWPPARPQAKGVQPMPDRMDRSTLLVRLQEAHAELEAALAAVDTARLSEPGVTGDWSVRDLLDHVCFWEQRLLWRLGLSAAEQPAPLSEPEMHRVNAESVAAARVRTPAETLAAHRQVYAELLATVSALGEAELNGTVRLGEPGGPLWEQIASDTYEHYEEHAAEIRAWLDGTAAPTGSGPR
ncbi:MAG TPA: maleylpyruvate isomerase N-terminal domain-containing protein [Dehalococcoidia bacterium]|nr:maleylpyruvate isomerase N-terminal domain-containing protein [Dehalococcoidia bacterium]